jgi:hypothetical protein
MYTISLYDLMTSKDNFFNDSGSGYHTHGPLDTGGVLNAVLCLGRADCEKLKHHIYRHKIYITASTNTIISLM